MLINFLIFPILKLEVTKLLWINNVIFVITRGLNVSIKCKLITCAKLATLANYVCIYSGDVQIPIKLRNTYYVIRNIRLLEILGY